MTSIASPPVFTVAYLEAVRDVQYQIAAAFSFMAWDFLLTLEEETTYIWGMQRSMFKWFYFYFRYILLVLQIFNVASSPSLSSGRISDFWCNIWYRYVVLTPQFSMSMIDIILATRVYALFNRSRKVGVFLGSLILSSSALAGTHMVKYPATDYFEACMLLDPHDDIATVHTTVILIVQSTIMGMIVFKHSVGARPGWGRTPLLSFLVRDAASNYAAVFLLCGVTLAIFGFNDQRAIAIF